MNWHLKDRKSEGADRLDRKNQLIQISLFWYQIPLALVAISGCEIPVQYEALLFNKPGSDKIERSHVSW